MGQKKKEMRNLNHLLRSNYLPFLLLSISESACLLSAKIKKNNNKPLMLKSEKKANRTIKFIKKKNNWK